MIPSTGTDFVSNALQTPLRTVWSVSNHQTETLIWPARLIDTKQKKTIVFFIPGTPGIIDYYSAFLQYIYELVDIPNFEIVGVSHKGHTANYCGADVDNNALYTVEDQIDHKVDCLDSLLKETEPGTDIILIGHSAGAFIATEVLKKRQNHGIKQVIALFPTLMNLATTPKGVTTMKLYQNIPMFLFGLFGLVVSCLPSVLREYFVSTTTSQKGVSLRVTAHQFFKRSVLLNTILFARGEMKIIKELDLEFYREHIDKFIMYYSPVDQWAPKDHYEFMVKQFPQASIHLCQKGTPHAFTIDPVNADFIAGKVASWINDNSR